MKLFVIYVASAILVTLAATFVSYSNRGREVEHSEMEQRRYEIAKEMLPTIYSINQSKNLTPQQMANIALIHADELIKELVKK